MSRRTWIAAGGLLALVVVVVIGLRQADRPGDPSEPLSRAAVAERLRDAPTDLAAVHRQGGELLPGGLDGLQRRLGALRGRPVVVNVWASWCGPCRAEMPMLQRAAVDYGSRVAFLGVDTRDNRAGALRILDGIALPYPSYEDGEGTVDRHFKLIGTPSTIFVDARGETFVHQGAYAERDDLDEDIDRYALKQPSA